ncbi:MAG: oligosaccharide flippase family protein [Candidatus Coproplasma sp.]
MANNVYRSAAQVTIFSTIEKSLSFIYRIILSRVIGAEGVGIYQICLSVFAVFLTAASSGIPVTVSRLIAKQSVSGSQRGKHAVVTAGVLCTLAFTVPASVIIFFGRNLLSFLFPDDDCLNIFILLLPGLILTSIYAVMRGTFWGNKQFLPYSVIELAEDAVMVITGCILIGFAATATQGAFYASLAVLISYVFSFAVSVGWYIHKGGRFVNPGRQIKPLLASSLPITAMRTSTSLINSVVAMFLPALLMSACGYTNSQALALYGAVTGMSLPILFIPNSLIGSIAVVVAPEMSENYYAKRTERLKSDVEKTIKASVFIASVLIPVLFTLGEDIGLFLFSDDLCGVVISRFSFLLLPMCLSMITTTILNSMNMEVRTLIYFFIGALAMLACIFALTPKLGINSYMVGLTLSYVITAILNMRLLKKKCEGVNYLKYTAVSAAIAIIACIFGKLLKGLLSPALSVFWQIVVCGSVILSFAAAAFYGMEMLSFKPLKKLFSKSKKSARKA